MTDHLILEIDGGWKFIKKIPVTLEKENSHPMVKGFVPNDLRCFSCQQSSFNFMTILDASS